MKKQILTVLSVVTAAVAATGFFAHKPSKILPPGRLENITDYGRALADEFGISHIEVIMAYESPVYAAVHLTVEKKGTVTRQITRALARPTKQLRIWFLYRRGPIDPAGPGTRHYFKCRLSSTEQGPKGPRGKDIVFLQEMVQTNYKAGEAEHGRKTSLFEEKPLPLNQRVRYYHVLEKSIPDGEETACSIDFEISDKPIKTAG